MRELASARDDLDDFFAVETAVLDEDRAGVDAGDRAAGDEEARHICLECLRIVYGRVARVERDTCMT